MTDPVSLVVRRVKLVACCALVVGFLVGGMHAALQTPSLYEGTANASPANGTYSTNFASTENPISEGGVWLSGKAAGVDWSDVRTTPGKAFGTENGSLSGAAVYADSTAILNGTFGPDQEASATVFNNDTGGDWHGEVEL